MTITGLRVFEVHVDRRPAGALSRRQLIAAHLVAAVAPVRLERVLHHAWMLAD